MAYQSVETGGKLQRKYSRSASAVGARRHAVPSSEEEDKYPHEDHAELDGTLKAFVFGFNDGLSSNTCLMLGMASASAVHPSLVTASGLVGLFAGAASMAAGEWISGTLANSAERGEVLKEERHLRDHQRAEDDHFRDEMLTLGFSQETIQKMQEDMQKDKALKLKAHCKFEMGLEDVWDDAAGKPSDNGGSTDTIKSMLMMAFAFSLGACVPLLPWFIFSFNPHVTLVLSLVFALAASMTVGTVVARTFTPASDHPIIIASQVLAAAFAVAAVYGVGLVYQRAGGDISAATSA
eukprot:TRINITY_DN57149_c0_g1_i1.p1 TRINITY_DN57149_c0_g1~~TRINITY_DN57149_c0_g1_i1.p1  ORF type:complete len:294 (+),score=93.28 TRINITY_DN57149_c0_g1_i1:93-974(+)